MIARWLCLVAILAAPGCAKEAPGKFELAHNYDKTYSFNRRSKDNSGFDPMITCDKNRKNCRYIISADEMMVEVQKMFNIVWDMEHPSKTKKDSFENFEYVPNP